MDLLKLFDPKAKFERKPLNLKKPNLNHTRYAATTFADNSFQSVEHFGTDYAKTYIESERSKILEAARIGNRNTVTGKLDEVSIGTVPTVGEVDHEKLDKLLSSFNFHTRPNEKLPIFQIRDDIVTNIQINPVTIIEGVTGCGKSTQVPQFILDHCVKHRMNCNIIVTQPRRIAALSIAERVSKEREWPVGSVVGCQVGMYRNVSEDTRLTYCTTGVLLRKLIKARSMEEFTHIVIDEVHERDQEMDFLLLIVRKFLYTNSRHVRVVLMSATYNVEKFAEYFAIPTELQLIKAPILAIPKRRNHSVAFHYLCQLRQLSDIPEISYSEPCVSQKILLFCQKLLIVLDEIDQKTEYDMEDLLEFDDEEKPRFATLVFLPGILEIEEMHNLLVIKKDDLKWDIVILHSSITNEEQKRIFVRPPKGYRRIILSTNIAESSITIHNIKYVIDFCLTKQLVTNPNTNFQSLELAWASKANCVQRAGRTGRLMEGRVYRLVPKAFYERLPDEGSPEIMRCPLESLVLNAKMLDMGPPMSILALAIDPPDLSNIERTILLLKEAGGLFGQYNDPFDGNLTDLGRIMAALPVEIHVAKMIALGHVFSVLRDTIIMAASMSVKNMFSTPFKEKLKTYQTKIEWADGCNSDLITFLNTFKVWEKEHINNRLKRRHDNERLWCNRNYLQLKVLKEIEHLKNELTKRLEFLGIKETTGPNKVLMDHRDRQLILKVVIAGAFYPNYFIKSHNSALEDVTLGAKQLAGLDPTRTVFLQGWKQDQPGQLYAKRIQELFKDITPSYHRSIVEFDGSCRVYVSFDDDKNVYSSNDTPNIPGKVPLTVYKVLYNAKMNPVSYIQVMNTANSFKKAKELGLPTGCTNAFFNKENYERIGKRLPSHLPKLPSLLTEEIHLKIVNFVDPLKFWIHIQNHETQQKLIEIGKSIQKDDFPLLKTTPKLGLLVLADVYDTNGRALIESISKGNQGEVANVLFIDYGKRASVPVRQLRELSDDLFNIPALAIQCKMTGIKPSSKKMNPDEWCEETHNLIYNYTTDSHKLRGIVYSVVDSVTSLTLYSTERKTEINLNDLLIEEGFVEETRESYNSEYNHNLREMQKPIPEIQNNKNNGEIRIQNNKKIFDPEHREYLEYLQYDKRFLNTEYPEPPSPNDCTSFIHLRGPFSPLQTTLLSMATHTASKKVSIEPNSVNAIIMDDSDDPHERLMVAGVVHQNPSGSTLSLRNTTFMPNMPGLTALMCLIFAPRVELRRSLDKTHYIGALCGLGSKKLNLVNYPSLLPEHDIQVNFGVEFTVEDLQYVNKLRHFLSYGIVVKNSPDQQLDDLEDEIILCQNRVHDLFNNLVTQDRRPIRKEIISNSHQWGYYPEYEFLKPSKTDALEVDSIFPLFSGLRINKNVNEELTDKIFHIRELKEMAVSDPKLTERIEVVCKLCDMKIYGKDALRSHLFSVQHRSQEKDIMDQSIIME